MVDVKSIGRLFLALLIVCTGSLIFAQEGPLQPPQSGETVQSVLQAIQSRVNTVQTMQALLEYDEKDSDKAKDGGPAINPDWPEPPGRDVERGPVIIKRNVGAYLKLQRKKKVEEFVANNSRLWKYEHRKKQAKYVPSNWPVVNTFVTSALVMNVFVAMDDKTVKYLGTQMVEGEPCWVLEGRSPSKLSLVGVKQIRLKLWIGQQDGIPRLIHTPGKDDLYIRLKNVTINQPVDESIFQFAPPGNVKVKNIFGF